MNWLVIEEKSQIESMLQGTGQLNAFIDPTLIRTKLNKGFHSLRADILAVKREYRATKDQGIPCCIDGAEKIAKFREKYQSVLSSSNMLLIEIRKEAMRMMISCYT